MRRLKPTAGIPYGGCYKINRPDLGFVGEGTAFEQLKDTIRFYRQQRGLPVGSATFEQLEQEVCNLYPQASEEIRSLSIFENPPATPPLPIFQVAYQPPPASPTSDVSAIEADSDVIIPVMAHNWGTLYLCLTAMRTCRATTTARIIIYGNNTPDKHYRDVMKINCEMLGCRWVYSDQPFSIASCFNWGLDNTSGQYHAQFGSDVIFFPNWLRNIIQIWEVNPEFFTLGPISFHPDYPHHHEFIARPEPRIDERHLQCGAGQIWRRCNPFHYDDATGWECDSDLHQFIIHNKLREGYVLNSRVDHLITGFRSQIVDNGTLYRCTDVYHSAMNLKSKWGLT